MPSPDGRPLDGLLLDGPGLPPSGAAPEFRVLVERLYALARGGTKFGLERIERVLHQLDLAPIPTVHVAGSNGKGSTCAFLAQCLAEHGDRVGLFTSPHLISLEERIQIVDRDGARTLAQLALVDAFREVEKAAGSLDALSFFEAVTAAGLVAFRVEGLDALVIEAGLGARLDATRLVEADVAVLTDLSLEHTAILGESIEEIAREEGAVVRPGRPLVMADGPKTAMVEVDRMAEEAGAVVRRLGRDFSISRLASGAQLGPLDLGLSGPHQRRNAALALQALEEFMLRRGRTFQPDAAARGVARARWPGRMESVRYRGLPVLLDGAQNAHAARALASALTARGTAERSLHVVFGVLRDKDANAMLETLRPFVRTWTMTRPGSVRARDPEQLRALVEAPVTSTEGPRQAMERAFDLAEQDGGLILVCGSLYLVGDVRSLCARDIHGAPPMGGTP